MGRVLFMIKYYYNNRKYVTLTFDMWPWLFPWPWPWCLTLRLIYYCIDALKKNCTWRKNGTSFVISETTPPIGISSRNILRPTKSLYDFRFQSYGSKGDFHGSRYVWPWPWPFQGHLIFENSPFVPVHDWCTCRSDMSICNRDIAHWNIENSLCFIMGISVAIEMYVTFFGSIHFFANYIG